MRALIIVISMMMAIMPTIAQGVIDAHSHIITPDYLKSIESSHLEMDEGFPIPHWDAESQLAFMDSAGIGCSVLTMCAPQPASGVNGAVTVRQVNEQCALLKQRHSGRFKFCAAVPLPDVDAAIAEVNYAFDMLGADGIKLATNSYGQYLGDPELDTLMQVLNYRHAVVILHPHRPEPVNREVMNHTPLAMQEYLSETTRAIANMIARNIPARFPNVKFVVPHCGAYIPLAIPRMKSLYPVMKAKGLVTEINWDKCLASFYYDLAGAHSLETIKMMLTITSPDHILYGSDFPYVNHAVLCSQLERMKQYLTADSQLAPYKEMFLHENAEYLFGMRDEKPTPLFADDKELIVRIAEIEVHEQYLDQYLQAAAKVGGTSVEREPGVVCIFPMQMTDAPNRIRIIEIYRNQEAYRAHLATEHFKQYKQTTLHMVKSLKLVDTTPLDVQAMKNIFIKK